MSKAEAFEDEKRRIIESCFSRKDADGAVLESYITHIRIVEDGIYQSSPPPPEADARQKKQRIIIIGVRKSGRVRMHKARENGNGSFSIGKTWPLEDLTAIESFSGIIPRTPEQEQRKLWAGASGFTVTIGKPYYWQANSGKEKQFFISSLVKIYSKYMGGKVPELSGFEESAQVRPAPAHAAPPRQAPPAQFSIPISSRPKPPNLDGAQSQSSRDVGSLQDARPGNFRGPSNDGVPPEYAARMNDGRQGSVPRPLAREQPPSFGGLSVDNGGSNNSSRPSSSGYQSQQSSAPTFRNDVPPRSRGGPTGSPERRDIVASGRSSPTPTGSRSGAPPPAPPQSAIDLEPPPQRRRPPMHTSTSSISSNRPLSGEGMVPAPLAPQSKKESGQFVGSTEQLPEMPQPLRLFSNSNNTGPTEPLPAPPIPKPASTEPERPSTAGRTDEERPGLGPMIKKKSKADVASAFRKAASAANAFKPRAGGAAERLRGQIEKGTEGPDGIHAVVPAPSLLRTRTDDSSYSVKPLDTQMKGITKDIDTPSSAVTPTVERKDAGDMFLDGPPKVPSPEEETSREMPPPKLGVSHIEQELASIDVDPRLIGDRGDDLITVLEEIGWAGEKIHTKSIDTIAKELEQELNQAEIGGWLDAFGRGDDRVESIKKGIDACISECEELENLLTLYGVELGTSNEDIAYIEQQSHGLQVQAANQKLLQTELQSLLSRQGQV